MTIRLGVYADDSLLVRGERELFILRAAVEDREALEVLADGTDNRCFVSSPLPAGI